MMSHRTLFASLVALPLLFAAALPAATQDYDRPPPGYGNDDQAGPESAPRDSQDAAGMGVRINRLEGRIREMTGQIEELQNANRKLVQQLQKFQQDVDSRLTSGAGRAKRTEAEPAPASSEPPAADTPKPTRKARRDDAYDPETNSGSNPGQPKPLGSAASGQPDDNGSTPMDLSGGRLRRGQGGGDTDSLAPTLRLPSTTPKSVGGATPPAGPVVASVNPTSPRAAFDQALGFYKGKQYEDAEKGFVAFIQKNPKSRLAADATYYLGESYAQRGRSREAAEQYLKVSTEYASSSRAPDAMLHLGISLRALGAKEQACATFTEVGRKYPNAPAYVKSGVEREAKRAQC